MIFALFDNDFLGMCLEFFWPIWRQNFQCLLLTELLKATTTTTKVVNNHMSITTSRMLSRSLLFADRFAVVTLSSTCVLCRHNAHHRRTSSRFKWPQKGFMPSRTPYQMFPAISTSDEAKGFVSYLTKNERLLLLSQLQKFPEEQDFDGLFAGIVV